MVNRPLVSFCILTYNQEIYIKDAINSAFRQTYAPLEIIISDDCSTDNTVELVKSMANSYEGEHSIILNFNKQNLGIREHFNKVLYELVTGEIILFAGGDDVSSPERAQIYVDYFNKFPELMSISCQSKEVDAQLKPLDNNMEWDSSYTIYTLNDYIEHRDFIIYSGDSRGIRKDVINKFPPLKYPRAEDIYIFLRSLLLGSACYIRQPLVLRRNHENNASKIRNKKYEEFILQTTEDIKYAYQNKFITLRKKEMLNKKMAYVKEQFELYWNSPFSGIKPFFYRVLSRIFKVKK